MKYEDFFQGRDYEIQFQLRLVALARYKNCTVEQLSAIPIATLMLMETKMILLGTTA